MKKKVLEWVAYSKSTESKVNKLRRKIFEKPYSITFENSKDKTFNGEQLKADWSSFQKLSENLAKVKNALIQHNATTIITVNGEDMTLAYAINRYMQKSDNPLLDSLESAVNRYAREHNHMMDSSRNEKQDISNRLLAKANVSEKDRAIADATINGYEVSVNDPLNIVALFETLKEEQEAFLEEVNTKINLSNAECELDINLDD